MFQQFLTDV